MKKGDASSICAPVVTCLAQIIIQRAYITAISASSMMDYQIEELAADPVD